MGRVTIPPGEPNSTWTAAQLAAYTERLLERDVLAKAEPGVHGEGIRAGYRAIGIESPAAASDRAAHVVTDPEGRWLEHDEHRFDVRSSKRWDQPAEAAPEPERIATAARRAVRPPAAQPAPRRMPAPLNLRHLGNPNDEDSPIGEHRLRETIRRVCGPEAVTLYDLIARGLSMAEILERSGWSERTYYRRRAAWEKALAVEMDSSEKAV
jgi:hypothetical protein